MSVPKRSREAAHSVPRRRILGSLAALSLAAGVLTACGSSGGVPTLTWYINPDNGGQAAVAKNCSTDQYTITTQVLPQDATQQRVQLARRLAAHDSGHRPDEPRSAVHGRVRERRLPGTDPPGRAGPAEAAVVQGRGRGRHLGRQARGLPVLVQHPGALVPQVLRREGRHRHEQAGHVGPDHRHRVQERRPDRCPGEQVRGLLGLDQRPHLGRRRTGHLRRAQGGRRHDRRELAGRRRRGRDHRQAGTLEGRTAGPVGVERGHRRIDVRLAARVVHGELDVHLPQLRRDPAGRRQGHRLHPVPGVGGRRSLLARRTAASASGSAPTPTTWTTR